MGLESSNGANGGSINFLSIVYGGVWLKSEDKSHPKYVEETHTIAGKDNIKTGLRYSSVTGFVTGFSVRESDYGKEIKLELTDHDNLKEKYVIGYSVWDKNGATSNPKFNAAKDLLAALIIMDMEKPLAVSAWTDKGGFQKIGYKQDDKTLNTDPSWTPKPESAKYYIETPEESAEILLSVEMKKWDELKVMTPIQKLNYFIGTIEELYKLVEEFVTPKVIDATSIPNDIEQEEETQDAEPEVVAPKAKAVEPKKEVKAAVAEEPAVKESGADRLRRLRAEREAKKAADDGEDLPF